MQQAKRQILVDECGSSSESDTEVAVSFEMKQVAKKRKIFGSPKPKSPRLSPTSSPINLPSESEETITFSSPVVQEESDEDTIIISSDEDLEASMLLFDDNNIM